MSRVIKLQPGGDIPKPVSTFEWAGNQYDKNALKNAYAKKYQSELNSGKYNKRELQLLDEGFKQVVSAIDSDDFGRDISGEWNNAVGVSSTGIADKNIFGKLKRTDNNSISLATTILNDAFSGLSPHLTSKEVAPKKEQLDLNLRNRLQKRLMPGERGWNQNVWSDLEKEQKDESGKLFTIGRQQAIRDSLLGLAEDIENPNNKDKYQYQDFIKDPSEYAKQVRTLIGDGSAKGLLGDVIGDAGDLSALSKLGITGFEGLLQDAEAQPDLEEIPGETSGQKVERVRNEANEKDWVNFVSNLKKGDQSKQWGVLLDRKGLPSKPEPALFSTTVLDPFRSTVENPSLYQQPYNFSNGVADRPREEHKKSIGTYIKDWMKKAPDVKEFTEGDYVYIPDTLTDDNYVLRYNTKTNAVQKVLASESQSILKYIRAAFMQQRSPNIANRGDEFKEGGIFRLQFGDAIRQQRNALYKTTKQEPQRNEALKQKPQPVQKPVQKPVEKGTSNIFGEDEDSRVVSDVGWSGTEVTRLAAAAADLVSMGLAYIPTYGTVASFGTGLGSTIANASADIVEDGLDWGDAGRFVANLGADFVGVVPGFGASAKGSKIIKSITRFGPKILTAAGSIGMAPALYTSMKKAFSDEKLTAADYRNFAEGLKMVLATGKGIKRGIQGKELERELSTGNNLVKTTKGFEQISPTALNELKLKKGIVEQNNFIKELGLKGSLETKFGGKWFNPTRNMNNPEVIPEYNFTKPKTRMTSAGEVLVKRNAVEQNRINNMQRSTLSISSPLSENLKIRINDVRYRGTRKAAEAMPNMNKIRVEYTKKNSQYSKLTNKELLEQFKDEINPTIYNAAKKEIIPPTRTMDLDLDELKLGGILKRQLGGVMNRETVPAPNPYLMPQNTVANASDPRLWDKYYNLTKAMSDISSNKWASNATVEGLNNLYGLREQVPTNLNQKGALNFNTAFDKNLGILNTKIFGKDANKFDYMGPSTYNRKAILDRMAQVYNRPENTIETADGKAYFNGTRWTTLPLYGNPPDTRLANNLTTNASLIPTSTTKQQSVAPRTGHNPLRPESKQASQFLPEDAIALGRMIGTVGVNNWANRRMQSAMRPTLIDTYENYIPQTEDYLAKTSAYNNAAELQRQAKQIASGTSDASLGAAAMLQGTSQGNQVRFQGDMANAQRLYQTGEQSRAESNAAKARRVEVANRNKGAMNQIAFAKAQMDAQTRQGNWMQAIQPWAAGVENRIRTNRGIQKQVDLESAQLNSHIKYAKDMQGVQKDYSDRYKTWIGQGNKGTQQDWLTENPTEYEGYNTAMFNLQSQSQLNSIKDKSLLGRGSLFFRPLGQYSQYKARGGKLTAKDTAIITRAKDFNKSMREQQKNFLKELQSIRKENSQMMRQVSSFTAQLIKSGMSWK